MLALLGVSHISWRRFIYLGSVCFLV